MDRPEVSASPADATRARAPSLGAIFLTVFLDLLGFGLVLPFLAEQARDSFHSSAFVATLLASVYSLMQFLFVPVWGRLSDRIGRRPVLLWSVFATMIGMIGLGVSLAFGLGMAALFVARIWSGIATANLGTASAYIADVTKPEDRAKGMGLIGMAFGLGFILGPGIGGVLAQIPVNGRMGSVPCFVAAGLSLVNWLWVLLGLGESLPPSRRNTTQRRSLSPLDLAAMKQTLATPGVGVAVLVNFLLILSFTNLDQTFRFYNKDLFGLTARGTGLILAFIGVVAALVQGGLVRRLSKTVPDVSLIRAGTFLQAIAFAGYAIAPSIGMSALIVSGVFLAFGNGLTQPSVSAYVSKRADASSQGATLGTNQAAGSLARMFGPAVGGWLYGSVGPRSPYVTAAIGMVIALVVTFALKGDQTRKTSTQTS